MTTFVFKDALQKVVGDPEFSDVILEAKESDDGAEVHEIHASKFVLSVRSEVFRKMLLENSFKEGQTNRVVCSAFNAATMKSLVHYLYTEEIISCSKEEEEEPGLSEEVMTPASHKATMVNFQELTDLYNAGHFYDIHDLIDRVIDRAKESQVWRNEEAIPSLLYAACHVVDFEASKYYAFIQTCIRLHVFDETIALEVLKDNVGPDHLYRVINETTTSTSKDKCYYWLNLLQGWASQSDKHILAAQDVMKRISCNSLNVNDLNRVYTENTNIMSDDVAIEKFQTLALVSNKELVRVRDELKTYTMEVSTQYEVYGKRVVSRIHEIIEKE